MRLPNILVLTVRAGLGEVDYLRRVHSLEPRELAARGRFLKVGGLGAGARAPRVRARAHLRPKG